jgi:hypothetical protein
MREALFTVSQRPYGTLIGENAALGLVVCAMERETLQEEARDALIHAIGQSHVSYRVRLLTSPRAISSTAVRNQALIPAALKKSTWMNL